jgi:hypothetical protein
VIVAPAERGVAIFQQFTNRDNVVAGFFDAGRFEANVMDRTIAAAIVSTARPREIKSKLTMALAMTEGSRVTGLVTRGPDFNPFTVKRHQRQSNEALHVVPLGVAGADAGESRTRRRA